MHKRTEHPHSAAKAHSGHNHKPEGRVMPAMRDAKNESGKLDFGVMAKHAEAIASSLAQGEYVPEQSDGHDGTATAEQANALKVLGVHAEAGWDFVALAGKRQA